MMPKMSSMTQLYSLGQENHKVQHDFFGNVMPLVLESVSDDCDSVITGNTAFLRARQFKYGGKDFYGQIMPSALPLVLSDVNSIINGTITFLRSR